MTNKTIERAFCQSCGSLDELLNGEEAKNYLCETCAETSLVSPCCEIPKDGTAANVSLSTARLSGGLVATCSACAFVCAYWECACELVHECEAN